MSATNSRNRTIAVASGKGGVGKTFITANLGLALAQQIVATGRVTAADLDFGCSNLHTSLGVRTLNTTIADFLLQRAPSLDKVLTPTEQRNLQLLGGSNGVSTELQDPQGWKDRLAEAIQELDTTFTIIDLAAGSAPEVIDFFLAARERIVVIVPESLSLHNAFMYIKTAILRLVDLELSRFDYLLPVRDKVREITGSEENIEIKMLLERLREWDLVANYLVRGIIDELRFKIVVNMYRGGVEKTYLQRFHNLLLKHLYQRNFEYLGIVHFGKNVRRTVQGQRPFLLSYPQDSACVDLRKMAAKLVQNQEDLEPRLTFPESRWFPGILKK